MEPPIRPYGQIQPACGGVRSAVAWMALLPVSYHSQELSPFQCLSRTAGTLSSRRPGLTFPARLCGRMVIPLGVCYTFVYETRCGYRDRQDGVSALSRIAICAPWRSRRARSALEDAHVPSLTGRGFLPGQLRRTVLCRAESSGPLHRRPRWGSPGFPARALRPPARRAARPFFTPGAGVAAGIYDVVLVAGVEKMTSQPTPRVTEILAGRATARAR